MTDQIQQAACSYCEADEACPNHPQNQQAKLPPLDEKWKNLRAFMVHGGSWYGTRLEFIEFAKDYLQALRERDEWEHTLSMAGCWKDKSVPVGWINKRAEKAEAALAAANRRAEEAEKALRLVVRDLNVLETNSFRYKLSSVNDYLSPAQPEQTQKEHGE